jgi:hypothetical protein
LKQPQLPAAGPSAAGSLYFLQGSSFMIGKHLSLLLILVLPLFGACASPFIEFQGQYWAPDFSFEARIIDDDAVITTGTNIDFVDDLGLPKSDNFPGGRLRLFTGDKSWIRLDYVPFSWDGDNNLTRTLEFNGEIYTAGARVMSEFDMAYGRFGWGYQFIDIGDGIFKLGTLLEAKAFDLHMKLDAPTIAISEEEDFAFGLPTLGLVMDINPVEFINIYAEGSGIRVGSYGTMYDAEAGLRYIPVKWVTITAGYRVLHLDIEVEDNEADLHLCGPFIGGSIRF